MMRLIRPTSLITLCTLLVISLFLPQVPNSAEQWLTTLPARGGLRRPHPFGPAQHQPPMAQAAIPRISKNGSVVG